MRAEKKSYYAILPAHVRYDRKITPNAKLLYAEITALTNERGYCWASNRYFADLYEVSMVSISKWISQLVDHGYLRLEMISDPGRANIKERRIFLTAINVEDPHKENLVTPMQEIFKENIIADNTKAKIFSSEVTGLVDGFIARIRLNDPQFKDPNVEKWKIEMKKLIDLDKRDPNEVWRVIKFATSDGFWKSNILSPKKLRDKYSTLLIQSKRQTNGTAARQLASPTAESVVASIEAVERDLRSGAGR